MDEEAQSDLEPIKCAAIFLNVVAGIGCLISLFALLAIIAMVALVLSVSGPWEENERYEYVPNPTRRAAAEIHKHLLWCLECEPIAKPAAPLELA